MLILRAFSSSQRVIFPPCPNTVPHYALAMGRIGWSSDALKSYDFLGVSSDVASI